MINRKYNTIAHHRRSIRLKGYDYSQSGAYFVTICTKNRECLFGKIKDGKIILNDAGKIAKECWRGVPIHYPFTELNEFIIMPNHIHGILVINKSYINLNVGVQNFEPLQPVNNIVPPRINLFQKIIPGSIGVIIRGYKIGVTKWLRANTNIYTVWQRNYYEHVIRNEDDLNRIREYIVNNPKNWENDELYQ